MRATVPTILARVEGTAGELDVRVLAHPKLAGKVDAPLPFPPR